MGTGLVMLVEESFSLHCKNGKKVMYQQPYSFTEKFRCVDLPAGLKAVRLTVTHRMSADIFAGIFELGRVGKKKGGKKRGKRKVSSSIQLLCNITSPLFYAFQKK